MKLLTFKKFILKVLSLFDGMSCGRIALERAGIKVEKYFASEIDKYAIQISKKNYPEIIHLGDINNIHYSKIGLKTYSSDSLNTTFIEHNIDLLIGGSPCQSLSIAGDGSGFDGKSRLFFQYVRLLREIMLENPNLKFMLENVKMKKEWQDIISKELGVEPILINSKLVSGQNRNRFYWTNIEGVEQPTDKNIFLKDVLEENVDEKYFYSEKAIEYLDRSKINKRFAMYADNKKSICLTASFSKSLPYNVFVDREKANCLTSNYVNIACNNYNKIQEQIIFLKESIQANKTKESSDKQPYIQNIFKNVKIRRLTPTECEKLQTVPINYTQGVSDTQRYKMLGNGWTIDVIAHIFSYLKQKNTNTNI